MKFVQWTLVSFVMIGVLATYGWASNPESDEVVPKNAKSAKDVVSQLQQQGTTNIRSVEYDDNQWNVKAQHGQKETHYKVDAKTGNVTKKQESSEYEAAPPNHVLGVLEIINTAEKEGVNGIREVEYDDSLWKVEAVQDGKVTKICFDPIAGDVIWSDTQPTTGTDTDTGTKTDTDTKADRNDDEREYQDYYDDYYDDGTEVSEESEGYESTTPSWQQNQNPTNSNTTTNSGSSTSKSSHYPSW